MKHCEIIIKSIIKSKQEKKKYKLLIRIYICTLVIIVITLVMKVIKFDKEKLKNVGNCKCPYFFFFYLSYKLWIAKNLKILTLYFLFYNV